jgi:ribonuclease Y
MPSRSAARPSAGLAPPPVKPEHVDDIQAQVIARDVAKQVEQELTYPGQIRVTVVRESRATEFAR